MGRNRLATEGRLLDAARSLIAEKGLAAYGVNAVADRAGSDKVLIYRYFDGATGLLARLARSEDFFPPVALVVPGSKRFYGDTSADLLAFWARETEGDLSHRPLTLELARSHATSDDPLCQAYRQARQRFLGDTLKTLKPNTLAALALELLFRRMETNGFQAERALAGLDRLQDKLVCDYQPEAVPPAMPGSVVSDRSASAPPAGQVEAIVSQAPAEDLPDELL